MKQTPLILSIIALVAVAALGIMLLLGNGNGKKNKAAAGAATEVTAKEGAIVWFDMDRVLSEYDMYNDLNSVVSTKGQGIQDEIDRRSKSLQSSYNKLQADYNKGILISSVAQQRSQKLQEDKDNLDKYVSQKQQEMAGDQQEMMNKILQSIKTYLDKFNEDKKYAMILVAQGSVLPAPVAVGDPDLDITDAIIAGLNEEYVKSKESGTAETPAAAAPEKAKDTKETKTK